MFGSGMISKAVARLAGREIAKFDSACREPAAAQADVLRNLIDSAATTEFGLKHGFARIHSPEQFRQAVPLINYETIAPLWHRAFDGARDVAWPGHVRYFALSSGTTAGNKLLPVTEDAIRSNKRSGRLLLSFLIRRVGAEPLCAGKFFYLGGSTSLREKGQSFYGDASGIMGRRIPFFARKRYLPGPDIAALSDWEEKIARVVERYLHADVVALSACPSWAALLFKQMTERAGGSTIGELWPKLACFISYGMSFEPYRKAYDEYIGRSIQYVDTYSSSEGGMTAIQEEPGVPLRLIINNGVFFEFIPADKSSEANPPRLHIGEVETGRDYEVVISSNGGIWAYRLGDVVRFESLRPPRIAFSGRTRMSLSAFGEHVTLEMIETAVAHTCEKTSARVADYTVAPIFPSPASPKPAHKWIVEFERPPSDPAEFMAAVDRHIRARNEDYDTHRTNDYGMTPPVLVQVRKGTFYEWMKQKGKLGGQHKVPRVAVTPEMTDELAAISRGKA